MTSSSFSALAMGDLTHYGTKPNLSKLTKLDAARKNFENIKGETLLVEGQVTKVCEKKGCWMSIKDGSVQMRVKFKGYSFFVPKDLQDRKVRVQGQMILEEQSVASQRHYLEDAGASQKEIDAVTKAKKTYQFIATGLVALETAKK